MKAPNGRCIGTVLAVLGLSTIAVVMAGAQTPPSRDDRPLQPLNGLRPPAPPAGTLTSIVKDNGALVALGKALFWDTQVANANGQACASCHFHAGADIRKVNQLSPGLDVQPTADLTFGNAAGRTGSGAAAGPNYALQAADFPFHKLANVNDRESAVLFDTNDVAASQGSFQGGPVTLNENNPVGQRTRCVATPGAPFAITASNGAAINTRKVEPRNTPTAINSAFNHRNFWDGRANNVFNGVNPFGRRAVVSDPAARVYRADGKAITPQVLDLPNMSAASQAVGPVLSSFEMTCEGKSFADVGRRLMQQRALQGQAVAADDSVFSRYPGGSIVSGARGLSMNYRQLVRAAFQPAYWDNNQFFTVDRKTGAVSTGGGASRGYQIDELNFAMFFGLAVDAYERTLISDQSPFDAGTMSSDAAAGMALFSDSSRANCIACHDGALFSKAATWQGDSAFQPIEHMPMAQGTDPALYDHGFYNIGVRPTFEDIGVGNNDPYGNPLSFTRQFVLQSGTSNVGVDRFSVDVSRFQIPLADLGNLRSHRVALDGAFKVPSLRNVALTPPYFHNGGQATLAQVVEFYNRGGDRRSLGGSPSDSNDTTGSGSAGRPVGGAPSDVVPRMGGSNAHPDVRTIGLNAQEQGQIVAFLQALTDRRVACHAAPFDHPELVVPDGQLPMDGNRDGNADDQTLTIRAVGGGGYGNCDALLRQLNAGDLFGASSAFINLR